MSSMLGKHKITVEPGNLADGDSIAAYLVDAAGSLLTSTLLGAKQRLDVINPSEYAEDSAHASGDYGQFVMGVRNDAGTAFGADGDYVPLSIDASGALRVNASINFAGDYAEDSAHASGDIGLFSLLVRQDTLASSTSADGDYGAFKSNAAGELYVVDSSGNAILTTINTSLDNIEADADEMNTSLNNIEADIDEMNTSLNNVEASVASIDTSLNNIEGFFYAEDAAHVSGNFGIQSLAVRKDAYGSNVSADNDYASLIQWGNGDLKVVNTSNGSILQQRVSVTDAATALPASALAFRKSLMIQNASNKSVWVGSATVTASGATSGIEVPKGSFMELEVGPAVPVYAISAATFTNDVNILQMA